MKSIIELGTVSKEVLTRNMKLFHMYGYNGSIIMRVNTVGKIDTIINLSKPSEGYVYNSLTESDAYVNTIPEGTTVTLIQE
tara:strand:- start:139 stop:381 length:243 start_codon:yes stop_codon:yes gene_type:complete